MSRLEKPANIEFVNSVARQNHYQRLGLNSNAVSFDAIERAYQARLALLPNLYRELSSEQVEQVREMISVAFLELSDRLRRAKYDRILIDTTASQQPSFQQETQPPTTNQPIDALQGISDGSANLVRAGEQVTAENQEVDLMGSPAMPDAPYESNQEVTWNQVVRDPAVLLRPEGRTRLSYLGLGMLFVASMALLLYRPVQSNASQQATLVEEDQELPLGLSELQPSQPSLSELAKEIERSIEPEPDSFPNSLASIVETARTKDTTPTLASRWTVRFDVFPRGSVREVDGMTNAEEPTWSLAPGTHIAKCVDAATQREFDATIVLPEGSGGDLTCRLEVPARFAVDLEAEATEAARAMDPYHDVRGFTYFPRPLPLTLAGASDLEKAEAQAKLLREVLVNVSRHRAFYRKQADPLKLPDQPVDPRATFTSALIAHQNSDSTRAAELSCKSLADARYYHLPFLPPLQLLNRVQLESSELAPALSECRSTLMWLVEEQTNSRDPHWAAAIEELCWWTGTLVGFVEDAKSDNGRTQVDTSYTVSLLRQHGTAEQWSKYRIGRRQIYDQSQDLQVEWAEFINQRQTAQVEAARVHREYAQKQNAKEEFYGFTSDGRYGRLSPYAPFEIGEEKQSSLPKFSGPSRLKFTYYIPLDVTALADRARESIQVPSFAQFRTLTSTR